MIVLEVGRLLSGECDAPGQQRLEVLDARGVGQLGEQRRSGETLQKLLERLDAASDLAWTADEFTDEINTPLLRIKQRRHFVSRRYCPDVYLHARSA